MKINGIISTDYAVSKDLLTVAFAETTEDEVLALDTATLEITTDDGQLVETIEGWSNKISVTKDLLVSGTFVLVLAQPPKEDPALLEEIEKLQGEVGQLKDDVTALEEDLDKVLPTVTALTNNAVINAAGDYAKTRTTAALINTDMNFVEVRDWEKNMTTAPGELVHDPDKKYAYMYAGKDVMTHANQLFFPGATGVYYWAIIPNTKNGHKIYPEVQGIIVAVRKDELWYDPTGAKLYRWNASDWSDCSYAAGSAGVHQWVEVEESV